MAIAVWVVLWGSRLVCWAAIKAVARYHGGNAFTEQFHAIAERRGRTRANVAIARKVLTLVYYGLRDAVSAGTPAE